jgi:glycosyltransferase involved in cell wall biosynthesis
MTPKTILLSINASWNIVNFRLSLIAGLQREGYRVSALAPPDRYSERLEGIGVAYQPIAMDRQGISPVRDLLLLWRYYRLLGRVRPDIYLGYTPKPNIYGSLAAHARGIPVINNVAGLGTAFIRRGWLTLVVKALYRLAFARSRLVFFQNEEDLRQFVDSGIVRAARARLLPGSGIDLARFAPAGARAEGPVTFLLIGRLLWDKGVGEYAAAARLLRDRLPEARFQLLGPLDVPNRTAVSRAEVAGWVAEGLIDYLGEADDVRPFIAAADCIVLPSYREGLPRTLLEGAAMARPLIATDVPGCRAVVDHGGNGLLCAAHDARALAEAMLEMARLSPEERDALGAAGRAKVEAGFGDRIVVGRYLEAVREALS